MPCNMSKIEPLSVRIEGSNVEACRVIATPNIVSLRLIIRSEDRKADLPRESALAFIMSFATPFALAPGLRLYLAALHFALQIALHFAPQIALHFALHFAQFERDGLNLSEFAGSLHSQPGETFF